MDVDLKTWLLIINLVGEFSIGCWLYLEKRNDKTNDRVTDLAKSVEKLDKDVSALQASTIAAPNHADLAKVYDSINSLAATVHTLVGENRGQSDTLRLILNRITEKGMQ